MELRQLRYFVAVAEELHFRRAAERLYVAQPAVSEQVRKLEAELGVRLFNRTNRRVEITDAGAVLLEEGRRVLAQAERAQRAARNARTRSAGQLRIGFVADALPASVPHALQRVACGSAGVDVSTETGSSLRLIRRVHDGELDAVVAGLPAPTAGLHVTSLGRQGLVVAMPRARDAAPASARLADLAPDRIVTLPRDVDPPFHDLVLALCRDADIAPQLFVVPEPRVDSVLMAVTAGAGIAVLPSAVMDRHATPGVQFTLLEDGIAGFETAVLTRPDTDNPATDTFLRTVVGLAFSTRSPAVERRAPLRLAA